MQDDDIERAEIVMWVALRADDYEPIPIAVAMDEEGLRLAVLRVEEIDPASVEPDYWPHDLVVQKVPARFALHNHFDARDLTIEPVDWEHEAWSAWDGAWVNRKERAGRLASPPAEGDPP